MHLGLFLIPIGFLKLLGPGRQKAFHLAGDQGRWRPERSLDRRIPTYGGSDPCHGEPKGS